jgi:predicted ATPase
MFKPHSYALLAQAYLGGGHISESLRVINEALTIADRSAEHWIMPELYRMNGEILLRASDTLNDTAAAESCFEQSLALARANQARSWELRTAIGMADLRRRQGKHHEARDLLAPIYSWFTEGFDSRDLQDAKALLEELG